MALNQTTNELIYQNILQYNDKIRQMIELKGLEKNVNNPTNDFIMDNLDRDNRNIKERLLEEKLNNSNKNIINNSIIDISEECTNVDSKENKSYFCSFDGCKMRFESKWILDRHMNSHESTKLFKCEYKNCEKSYKSRENLNLHMKNKHLGLKPYECKFCSNKFSHRNGK